MSKRYISTTTTLANCIYTNVSLSIQLPKKLSRTSQF